MENQMEKQIKIRATQVFIGVSNILTALDSL